MKKFYLSLLVTSLFTAGTASATVVIKNFDFSFTSSTPLPYQIKFERNALPPLYQDVPVKDPQGPGDTHIMAATGYTKIKLIKRSNGDTVYTCKYDPSAAVVGATLNIVIHKATQGTGATCDVF
ncbi:MAG: hypothetical protein BGO77_08415 [Caedibacter sp. 37-49]|nr:MAG: hypothetical protein BGO77_08415 [Caedibacter sp. 37-49]